MFKGGKVVELKKDWQSSGGSPLEKVLHAVLGFRSILATCSGRIHLTEYRTVASTPLIFPKAVALQVHLKMFGNFGLKFGEQADYHQGCTWISVEFSGSPAVPLSAGEKQRNEDMIIIVTR